jgi:hypothetical protein
MTPDGAILWSGPTVHPPNGHNIVSAGSFSESRFSFSVGKAHDPQSDAFNGIWDNVSGSEVFNIEGKGEGTVDPATISGIFKGVFADHTLHENGMSDGAWCTADDHRFTFTKQ